MIETAILRCAVDGCPGRIRIPLDHLANLLAAGWECPGPHNRKEEHQ